jgi:hypothetical protein
VSPFSGTRSKKLPLSMVQRSAKRLRTRAA